MTKVMPHFSCSQPMLKPTCLTFFLLLIACFAQAQLPVPVMENNPATLKWNEIITDHFNILFPEGFEIEGQRIANTLEHLHGPASRSLGKKPRPIPIILQNQGVISNGFVTLGPRRSEFYTSPPQDYKFLGNNDWLNTLATHEFRHVVQFDKAITGISKLGYWFFGEDVLAGLAFISTPLWFWEGDAVGIETAFSSSGRGRIPYFQALHRANVLDRGGFKYQKQYLRSFKDQIPNHYLTGYLMTTFLRRTYGDDILDRVTQRSFKWPILPFTFSRALKKETGNNLTKNYTLMSEEMKMLYSNQVNALQFTSFEPVAPRKGKLYTEYAYPQATEDGSLLAVRYGIGDISQLVRSKENGEWQALHTLGIWEDNGYLSSGGNKVVWNEILFHPRWDNTTFSAIKVLNLSSGKTATIGRRERYKGAGISPDGNTIVTVSSSKNNVFNVLLLDAESGEPRKIFENPGNLFYSMPQFSADGKAIVALKHSPPHKSIVSIDIETGLETEWIKSSDENLGHPVLKNEWLFYASDVSGIDNIYAQNLSSRQIFQVTSARLGAYNPHVNHDSNWVYYNEMTKNGWDVVKVPLDPEKWTPLKNIANEAVNYFQPIVEQENEVDILSTVPQTSFDVKKYKQYKHLLRPNGWGWVNTLSDQQIELGFYSQNILSTAHVDAGYTISLFEGTGYWSTNLSYQGLPAIFDAGAIYGTRSVISNADGEDNLYTWTEKGLTGGIRVPFNFTHSAYYERATIGAGISSTTVDNYNNPSLDIGQQRDGSLYATNYTASYSRLLKQSKRDIYPRWGQSIALSYFDTPFKNSDYLSSLWSAEAYLYLPGLFKHHSVRLRGAYQDEEISNYRFRSQVQYVRGYGYTSFRDLTTFSANYALPLLYPDLALGPFLYFQRVRTNLFYDVGIGSLPASSVTFNSVGLDLFVDYNIMRYLPTFSTGLRVVYIPEQKIYAFNLLLGSISF